MYCVPLMSIIAGLSRQLQGLRIQNGGRMFTKNEDRSTEQSNKTAEIAFANWAWRQTQAHSWAADKDFFSVILKNILKGKNTLSFLIVVSPLPR